MVAQDGPYDDLDGAAWRAIIDNGAPVTAVDGTVDGPIEHGFELKRGRLGIDLGEGKSGAG